MHEQLQVHWNSIARHWKHFGPPLRPCDDDLAVMRSAIFQHPVASPRVLMLGVTPEIAQLDWPQGTCLDAVERSTEMIDVVWPGDVPGVRRAHRGEWLELPFRESSFDVVIGDGCYISMKFPDGYEQLTRSIRRVLKPDGMLIMRFFVSPEEKEHPDDVITDLLSGQIGSFHAFKWRLAMAVQNDPRHGVCLRDVWRTWSGYEISQIELARQMGWTLESIQTIELYQDRQVRFTFPRREEALSEVRTMFDVKHIHTPTYELGERCPILCPGLRAD